MTCIHLKQLYDLCVKEDLKLGGTDLIRIVCKQCGEQEVCPSMLMEEYEAQHPEDRLEEDNPKKDEARMSPCPDQDD